MPYPCNNYFVLFLTVAFGVLFCVIIHAMKYILSSMLAVIALASSAAWKTERRVDEMTDAVSYFIESFGDRVGDEPFVYRPGLVVRIKPSRLDASSKKLTAETDVLIGLGAMDTISFTAKSVLLRFDNSPAERWAISRAKSPEAFFIADADKFVERLAKASTLKVRVDVVNMFLTLTFHVSDFSSEMDIVKNAILKTRPAGVEIVDSSNRANQDPPKAEPPKSVKCPKCHGTGRVEVWQKCPSCNGSTRGCAQCRTSGWIGRIKAPAECQPCKGRGKVTP